MANIFQAFLEWLNEPDLAITQGIPIMQNKPNPPQRRANHPNPITNLPNDRASLPQDFDGLLLNNVNQRYRRVETQFLRQVIPIIRKLMMGNENVSQAIHNVVTLGNTGHKVIFDKTVDAKTQLKMKNHLFNKRKDWATGTANMDGLVNKFFSQVLVSGALSTEWVPNKDLTGIDSCVLVNPEQIEFILDKRNVQYQPYQRVGNSYMAMGNTTVDREGLIKLNTLTYKYYALNGDTEIPYGFPPYMAVLPKIGTKSNMDKNIDFVVDQMGLLGFLTCLIDPEEELGDANSDDYTAKLEDMLNRAKKRVQAGFKDGVVIGLKDSTDFKFYSTGKEVGSAISDLYKNNEQQIGSALKQDPALWGRDYNTSEASMTVVFMKMLAELKNIQNIIKTNLEFGYTLELRLAGFQFDFLEVKFNRSTIADDLKFQQAEEIKLRNATTKMLWGLISQDQFADEMGYDEAAAPKALVPYEVLAGGTDPAAIAAKAQARQGQKNKSAKTVRKKNKPVAKDK